jgi:leucyl aminopeptidase
LKNGFRLHHAVGRGSAVDPVFINIAYNGNKDSSEWLALVAKGVLFDTGGLNLKSSEGIGFMFLDKHGACSCFSAF